MRREEVREGEKEKERGRKERKGKGELGGSAVRSHNGTR